tara:strand:+ start:564 stop:1085 length:522 start_codon:yes stop_codon:yes gene_type:complete
MEARHRPAALAIWLPYLRACQENYPCWIEVKDTGKRFETIRTQINSAITGWLRYDYPTQLTRAWWEGHWPEITVRVYDDKVYLAPRGDVEFNPALAEALTRAPGTGDGCLGLFTTTPPIKIMHACAVLLDGEYVEGHFRFAGSLDPLIITELRETYENVEVFKPDDQPYWVMM